MINFLIRAGDRAPSSASILAPRERGPDPAGWILLRLSLRRRPVLSPGVNLCGTSVENA